MGSREGVAPRSKLALGMLLSICTMVDMMIVRFVRPRPMVLMGLSVSMGPKGKTTSPPLGSKSFRRSLAVRSGLNLVKSTLRLSRASRPESRKAPRVAIPHQRSGRLERLRRAWCHSREKRLAPYRKSRLTTRGSARINAGSHSFRIGRFPTLARSLRRPSGGSGFGFIL